MTTQNQQDPDLISLESSLDAVESEAKLRNNPKYGPHPSWTYYYLCFLSLLFTLAILGIINGSRPTEPKFVELTGAAPKKIKAESEIKPELTEEERVAQEEAKNTTPKSNPLSDPWNYSTFTPEQLQKISNQLMSNPSSEFNVIRAEIYAFLGWYDDMPKMKKEAQNYANLSFKTDLQNPRFIRAMALTYMMLDQTEKARTYFSQVGGKLHDSLTSWIDAYLLIKTGKNQSGIEKLEAIRKKDPSFYPASYVLIQEYLRQNSLVQAREITEYWRSKSLSNLSFVHLVADLLDRQQQYVELVYYLNSFEKLYPRDWLVLFDLGKGNLKLQKKDLARSYYQRIVDAQENYLVDQIGKTYFELGKMSLFENDYKTSVKDLYQASQRIPNDMNVKFYLASAYFKNEDYENAIDVYKLMLAKDQSDPKIRIYLGMTYFEVGQHKLAEKNLLTVYNQGSEEPLLLYYLAKVEEQKGNIANAQSYLQKILTADPKHVLAKKMMERLKSQPAVPPAEKPIQ